MFVFLLNSEVLSVFLHHVLKFHEQAQSIRIVVFFIIIIFFFYFSEL